MSYRITVEQEKKILIQILKRFHVRQKDAATVAEVLADADMKGISSHGIRNIFPLLQRLKVNSVKPGANPDIVTKTSSIALIDGNHGLGHVIGSKAIELAIEMAKLTGIGLVGMRNSGPFGIAGYYADTARKKDVIGIVMTNSDPDVPPFGGIEKILGTNPIAIAIPSGKEPHISLDMATSAVAKRKIKAAVEKGERIPEGWAIDSKGRAIIDPLRFSDESLLPAFGGIKGYGIAIVVEILAGPLTGAMAGSKVKAGGHPKERANNGYLMMALDPSFFCPLPEFKRKVDELIREIKNCKKGPGVTEIFVPGEIESRNIQKALRQGISLDDKLWSRISELCGEVGIELQDISRK